MLRFIFKRTQFDSYSQAKTEQFETMVIESPAVQMMLQRGGLSESGHDVTVLVGVEIVRGEPK